MRIVINPGHHSWADRGVMGPSGLRESDVVRSVAIVMQQLDTYEFKRQNAIGLISLLWALRRNPPDVLLSLHCNSAPKLWKTSADCIHEARHYFWRDDSSLRRRAESEALALSLRDHSGMFAENATVRSAPYNRDGKDFTPGILVNTATLAVVLVELGFIHDPHVESAMRSPQWIERAANGVHVALQAWCNSLRRR